MHQVSSETVIERIETMLATAEEFTLLPAATAR